MNFAVYIFCKLHALTAKFTKIDAKTLLQSTARPRATLLSVLLKHHVAGNRVTGGLMYVMECKIEKKIGVVEGQYLLVGVPLYLE